MLQPPNKDVLKFCITAGYSGARRRLTSSFPRSWYVSTAPETYNWYGSICLNVIQNPIVAIVAGVTRAICKIESPRSRRPTGRQPKSTLPNSPHSLHLRALRRVVVWIDGCKITGNRRHRPACCRVVDRNNTTATVGICVLARAGRRKSR